MARKANTTKTIKVITTKDQQVINMLSKTGQATYSHLKELNNISTGRVQALVNTGLINVNGSNKGKVYSLGKKAYKMVSGGIYHKAGLEHDLKLSEMYLKLTEEQRYYVKTGDEYAKEHGLEPIGTPDMVIEYETEQVTEFVEVVTENYKSKDIELKETFKEQTNAVLKIVYSYKEGEVIK